MNTSLTADVWNQDVVRAIVSSEKNKRLGEI